ncbi:MAG: BON domain-containing protein [Alphaproteobacteria bacterium]|nr:BON domain-containing protein [Alphaproteobacteria bacterium]
MSEPPILGHARLGQVDTWTLGAAPALQQNERRQAIARLHVTEDYVHPLFRPTPTLAACLALLGLTALPSCVPVVVAGAAGSGAYVAGQERGVGTQASDTAIRAQINDLWLKYNTDMYGQLSLAVTDGRVLITGAVSNPEWKVEAVRLAWQANGVKEVDSEIQLSDKSSIADAARDELIATRLRSAMLFDRQVRSINYSIDVVNGVVYLSGSARTQGELDRVTDYGRNIPNVKRVVSYVKVRPGAAASAPDGGSAAPSAAAAPPTPAAPADAPYPANAAPTQLQAAPAAPIEVKPLQ